MSAQQIVGMGDCRLSANPADTLITCGLGSCIAVIVYDAAAKVGGLLHFTLPGPASTGRRVVENPWTFASTGVPLFLQRARELGALQTRMVVQLAGGAHVLNDRGVFDIGKKNYLAAHKFLWKEGVIVNGEAVGGNESRTVWLEMKTGTAWMRHGARAPEEMRPLKEKVGCLFAS